jgi:GT2 family glycosyltransferase/glycosyltransferase involved in cell wall biosynthesis
MRIASFDRAFRTVRDRFRRRPAAALPDPHPGVPPDLFDAEWYAESNPDVARAGKDSRRHFLEYGLAEGRSPNAFFAGDWYLNKYKDVASAGKPALLHYLRHGAIEGRDPHPDFDAAWYVEEHPDAADNPLLHHMRIGRQRGWLTKPAFDVASYLPSGRPAPTAPAGIAVDIIIPVFRGLEETRRCVESVLTDNERPDGDIIVVDDCSPEPELSRWLDEVAATGRIRLLRNSANLGFVRSVNRGMDAAGRHDVVLLNSDTEAPNGWLRRLMAHAYVGERVGTVTPFSNNATICSYPSLPGGPLPLGRTLAELDTAFQRANRGRAVEVPTAVGFAMYIRRDCLDSVGPFDAETFGDGYGEENDFCLRATAKGWSHLLACDTFVFHVGEVSFGKLSPLRDQAWKLLVARYSDYPERVSRHVKRDQATPARFAATIELLRNGQRPVILLICHAVGGGTERHVRDLIERTSTQAEYLILRPVSGAYELSVATIPGHPALRLPEGRIEDLVTLLRHFGVRRVHIHHLYGYNTDIRSLILLLGLPFDVTVHDYFGICPRINLISAVTEQYCGEPDAAGCNACIAATPGAGARDIFSWRWQCRWLFSEADRILCPTHDVQRRLARFGIRERTLVAAHDPVTESAWRVAVTSPASSERLRIAVIGTLAGHKGAAAVRAAVLAAPPHRFEFVLIGSSMPDLDLPPSTSFREIGAYQEADLPGLIADVRAHLIWFPASAPETYSYTLSAAIEAGLPIVASNIGAFPERLEGHPWTWLALPEAGAATWLAIFESVRAALAANVPPRPVGPRATAEAFYPKAYLAPVRATRLPTINAVRPLRDLRSPGRLAVLAVPEVMDNGAFSPCAYIRLLLPLEHLAQSGLIDLTLGKPGDALHYQADVMVCQRYSARDLEGAERLIGHARHHRMQLLYDLDDNLLDIPDEHPEAEMLRQRAVIVEQFVRAADTVFVSTEQLRTALLPRQSRVIVVENGLDERLLSPRAIAPASALSPVRILYMGSATHDADLALVAPALARLHGEFGRHVEVGVMGVTSRAELPPGVSRFGGPESASRSYPAFISWLAAQDDWHIGIAPLTDSTFNRSKSAIKALDYMAMGVAAVLSDVPSYRGLPENTVLRVKNDPDAWYAALAGLISDRGRRHSLATAGRQYLFSRGTLAAQASLRIEAWRLATSEIGRPPQVVAR